MKTISTKDKNFQSVIRSIAERGRQLNTAVEPLVHDIITQVRVHGDTALLRLTKKYEGHTKITVAPNMLKQARKKLKKNIYDALELAYRRITVFHRRQLQNSWLQTGSEGEILGQLVRPLERVGIYVPGGKAVYPSSVLMNAIPAIVAGVKEIIMVTPGSSRGIEPVILAAAEMCGISKVFQIGGAQAIAALAYGTAKVPRVDKIVGPGNIYVATAKKLVFGDVAIDMIAGPSEILILSDGSGNPAWAAADMLSQAEHDEMASALLITTDAAFARKVVRELQHQLVRLPKKGIAALSLQRYGAIITARDLHEAAGIANAIAPEHLELFVQDPWKLLPEIDNAGAVFLGYSTPEAVGDYIAGPNHVLPTGGSARFFSLLSVDDFLKKTSIVFFPHQAACAIGRHAAVLARAEELVAHARSVDMRLASEKKPQK